MTDVWADNIHRHFPNAMRLSEFFARIKERFEKVGANRRTTLLATSFCSDDVIVSKDLAQNLWGPFTLGGLGALPFGGRTAMSAYAHHIPDRGTALIAYGPHIGITRQGVLGRMVRPGQSHETASCGALMAALKKFSQRTCDATSLTAGHWPADDAQQACLEQTLLPYRSGILAAPCPEQAITEITYSIVHQQVQHLIELTRTQFHGDRIVTLGVLIINTDENEEDWVDLRHLDVISRNASHLQPGESTHDE